MIAGGVVEDLPRAPGSGAFGEDQQLRAAGIGTGEDLVVVGEVPVEGIGPGVGAEARIELGQRDVHVFPRGELHAAEQLVAHQDAETRGCCS